MPLEELASVMKKLGQKIVKCNESFVLVPKKSVVFAAHLHEKRSKKHSDCENCSALKCPMRQAPSKAKAPSKKGSKSGRGLIHLYTGEGKGSHGILPYYARFFNHSDFELTQGEYRHL